MFFPGILATSGGIKTGYDVVVHSIAYSARLIPIGVYQPLDKSKLPLWDNLDPWVMDALAGICRRHPAYVHARNCGRLLSFTLSLDDLVIASFVSGPGSTTLPMLIFSKVRLGVTPDINALATVIIVLVSIGVIMAAMISRNKEKTAGTEHG